MSHCQNLGINYFRMHSRLLDISLSISLHHFTATSLMYNCFNQFESQSFNLKFLLCMMKRFRPLSLSQVRLEKSWERRDEQCSWCMLKPSLHSITLLNQVTCIVSVGVCFLSSSTGNRTWFWGVQRSCFPGHSCGLQVVFLDSSLFHLSYILF